MKLNTEELAQRAKDGNRDALEHLIMRIQDKIYGLALKMLGHPEDAEDAAQEILIKVITLLGGFRGESSFETWMYRIASNHLLTTRKRRAEKIGFPLEQIEKETNNTAPTSTPDFPMDPENKLLVEEVRIRCMQATLLCLNRKERLAFILGEIFQVTGNEGAKILDITPATFRKRLSRGRNRVSEFMKDCGLINSSAQCQCENIASDGIKSGWLKPSNLLFAGKKCSSFQKDEIKAFLKQWDEMKKMAELFRSYPEYKAPDSFVSLARDYLNVKQRDQILH